MKKKHCVFIFLIVLIFGCSSIKSESSIHYKTQNEVLLGTMGSINDGFLSKSFETSLIFENSNPVKLETTKQNFSSNSYKAFSTAQQSQNKELKISYNDTLATKTDYLVISILDEFQIIQNLNSQIEDDTILSFINNDDIVLVSEISIAFDESTLNQITNADEVFLEKTGVKNYGLNLYDDGKSLGTVKFNDGVVFGYKTSGFCWKQNDRYQLEIVGLIDNGEDCPRKSYKSANRAKKKINYYKF